jgi:hypothetical protein
MVLKVEDAARISLNLLSPQARQGNHVLTRPQTQARAKIVRSMDPGDTRALFIY